jgi:hypothetical protein
MSHAEPAPAATETPSVTDPDVLAVCRWLPQAEPTGAFTGTHDNVHVGRRHGLVNLWWSQTTIHIGDYVGPPRGGILPSQTPTYAVAMPVGGYLIIEAGVVVGWEDRPGPRTTIRADGECFEPADFSPSHPYFQSQYRAMTPHCSRLAILNIRRKRLGGADATQPQPAQQRTDPRSVIDQQSHALLEAIAAATPPVTCLCDQPGLSPEQHTWPYTASSAVPSSLLRHASALATMAGVGNPDDAVDTVWRLTRELAHPARAGFMQAAESTARRRERTVVGLPEPPLTEEAVALVAAQAVRWHGSTVVPRLPFWTLGWIFLAKPVLDQLVSERLGPEKLQRALDEADQIRVDRARLMWTAANDAATALNRFAQATDAALQSAATGSADVLDLRSSQDKPLDLPAPRTPRAQNAYQNDIATTLSQIDSS